VRTISREWRRLRRRWQAGLRQLPFFTQRTAVLLVGVLVATLALLGGVVALVGWPGGTEGSGGTKGSGGAAGAGAGGPSAAPPTTTTTIAPGRPLDPVEELLGPVVSSLPP
jgi:hypothetical protein